MSEQSLSAELLAVVDAFFTPRRGALTTRESELLAQGEPLRLADGAIAASRWGTGRTVLLAHGWESRRTHWSSFVKPLVSAGFQVVAIDAPAHGESDGVEADVLRYTEALVKVGRELGPLAGVVGHSWGAAASILATDRGLAVQRCVLISGPASLYTFVAGWQERQQFDTAWLPAFVAEVQRRVGEDLEALDLQRAAARRDLPALIIHDERDRDIPIDDGVQLAATWPHARFLRTQRYGHRRILIAKEVVQAVVEFLAAED